MESALYVVKIEPEEEPLNFTVTNQQIPLGLHGFSSNKDPSRVDLKPELSNVQSTTTSPANSKKMEGLGTKSTIGESVTSVLRPPAFEPLNFVSCTYVKEEISDSGSREVVEGGVTQRNLSPSQPQLNVPSPWCETLSGGQTVDAVPEWCDLARIGSIFTDTQVYNTDTLTCLNPEHRNIKSAACGMININDKSHTQESVTPPNKSSDVEGEIFSCSQCTYTTPKKRYLVWHKRCHAEDKPFNCSQCTYSTAHKRSLKIHMRRHTGEKPFRCNQCSFTTAYKGDLNIHMSYHTGERRFSCEQCTYSSNKKNHLKSHIIKCHDSAKRFSCNQCVYSTISKNDLNVHMTQHTGQSLFGCNLCPYVSIHKNYLKQHMRRHTCKKTFGCDQCSYNTSNRRVLVMHMRCHKEDKGATDLVDLGHFLELKQVTSKTAFKQSSQ